MPNIRRPLPPAPPFPAGHDLPPPVASRFAHPRPDDDGRVPGEPPVTVGLTLTDRDLLRVANVGGGRYSVVLTLAPAARPTGQTDDVDERLTHAARFTSFAAAMRLCARVRRAGRIDVSRWLWEAREHGRFTAPPVATPYDVEAR